MKKKISLCVVCVITMICCVILTYDSQGKYYGIGFISSVSDVIFTVLSFISLSLLMRKRSDCLFYEDNIVSLTRISSRKKALTKELIKITGCVLLIETTGAAAIILTTFAMGNKIDALMFFRFLVLNFTVKLFLMILQFCLELYASSDFAFLYICVGFLLLFFAGEAINLLISENAYTGVYKIAVLKQINAFNIVNYISAEKAVKLVKNTAYPICVIISGIILQIAFISAKIKKLNILPKE